MNRKQLFNLYESGKISYEDFLHRNEKMLLNKTTPIVLKISVEDKIKLSLYCWTNGKRKSDIIKPLIKSFLKENFDKNEKLVASFNDHKKHIKNH